MSGRTQRNRREKQDNFPDVEARLTRTLQPVSPRSEYIRLLENNLRNRPDVHVEFHEPEIFWLSFTLAAGLLSGTVLLVLGVRALVALLGGLGVLQQLRGQIQTRRQARLRLT